VQLLLLYPIWSLFPHLSLRPTEIDHVMQAGKKNRSTGATAMNQTSSRSHSIFTIVVEVGQSDARCVYIVEFCLLRCMLAVLFPLLQILAQIAPMTQCALSSTMSLNLTISPCLSRYPTLHYCRGDHIRVGKLNLVDLAGSERQSKVRSLYCV
jgi:hypothetical protein